MSEEFAFIILLHHVTSIVKNSINYLHATGMQTTAQQPKKSKCKK